MLLIIQLLQEVETALGYDEIAASRVTSGQQNDRRVRGTEEELLAGRHHTLDLMDRLEDVEDEEGEWVGGGMESQTDRQTDK